MTASVFFGRYFDGRISAPIPVALRFEPGVLVVVAPEFEVRACRGRYRLPERTRHGQPIIQLAQGAQVEADDMNALWLAARAAGHRETLASSLAQSWLLTLLALFVLVGLLAAGYRWALPWMADQMAARLPPGVERTLGREALAWLDEGAAAPSGLPAGRQEQIEARFARLLERADEPAAPGVLLFRAGPGIGVNALALPGGRIVVTDELVAVAGQIGSAVPDEALLGVLAHEYGHLRGHHPIRRTLKVSVLAVAASALWGDVSVLAAVVPTVLGGLGYTRAFERQADRDAARVLAAAGLSVEPLVALFEAASPPDEIPPDAGGVAGWQRYLATHPVTEERVMLLRASFARARRRLDERGTDPYNQPLVSPSGPSP